VSEGARIARKIKGVALLVLLTVAAHVAESGVLRFWWSVGNVVDGQVNGVGDRENLFPVLLDIGPFVAAWSGAGVTFRLRGNGTINVAYTAANRNDVWALYRSDEVIAGDGLNLKTAVENHAETRRRRGCL